MNNQDIVERTYGIVAENKPLGQNNILVWPYQKTPWMQGDVQSQLQSVTTKTVDGEGRPVEGKATTSTATEAIWRPTDSSWDTAPDVQRGEVVELIRYSDMNVYFWRERGDGAKRRRLETKRLFVSANKTSGEPSTGTHYMLEISGHTGAINLTTSNTNGEVSTYHLTINAKGGAISLGDGEGNEIYLETKGKIIRLRNTDESVFEMNERDIAIHCHDKLIMVAKEDIMMQCNRLTLQANETVDMTANTRYDITSPIIALNGAIQLNGPISQVTTTSNYDATFQGTLRTTQDMVASNISLVNHLHAGVQRGGSNTDKPVGG